jgi:hypothetical protein
MYDDQETYFAGLTGFLTSLPAARAWPMKPASQPGCGPPRATSLISSVLV